MDATVVISNKLQPPRTNIPMDSLSLLKYMVLTDYDVTNTNELVNGKQVTIALRPKQTLCVWGYVYIQNSFHEWYSSNESRYEAKRPGYNPYNPGPPEWESTVWGTTWLVGMSIRYDQLSFSLDYPFRVEGVGTNPGTAITYVVPITNDWVIQPTLVGIGNDITLNFYSTDKHGGKTIQQTARPFIWDITPQSPNLDSESFPTRVSTVRNPTYSDSDIVAVNKFLKIPQYSIYCDDVQ